MLRMLIYGTGLFLAGTDIASAQMPRINCQTRGAPFYLDQNSKTAFETHMDENGCRYSYLGGQHSDMSRTLEKAVIVKAPMNGELSQPGEFSFFYKPKKGFKGKDSFIVYICGTTLAGSGCARLTYNATIR